MWLENFQLWGHYALCLLGPRSPFFKLTVPSFCLFYSFEIPKMTVAICLFHSVALVEILSFQMFPCGLLYCSGLESSRVQSTVIPTVILIQKCFESSFPPVNWQHLFNSKMIMCSMLWSCFCFLFLSLWLVNSEKEVQFECSDDGEDLCPPEFSYWEKYTLRNETVSFTWVNGVEESKSVIGQR